MTRLKLLKCLSFILVILIIKFAPVIPKMSRDPQIRSLQKEAMALKLCQKAGDIRFNAKELFGWSYGSFNDREKNNVSFRGFDGKYEIEYQDLKVKWSDRGEMSIVYDGLKVYRARITYWLTRGRVKEIRSFVGGPWVEVFEEMYVQAMKGPPKPSEADELKDNWGIG